MEKITEAKQQKLLRHKLNGLSETAVAVELGISERTVSRYFARWRYNNPLEWKRIQDERERQDKGAFCPICGTQRYA
ncbi:hypothetical protein FACS1894217_01110 [Clostridia bacterium]|nr:hypothetical protein FACS1894217_01110 [Clostridia bacterium]